MSQRSAYGGQAVIEGVMIRGKERVATAVRLPDGTITIRRESAAPVTKRHRWLGWAFLRGLPAMIDSLRLGYRTLMWSGDVAMEGEGQRKPTPVESSLAVVFAVAVAVGFFMVLPALVTKLVPIFNHSQGVGSIWQQLTPSPSRILPNIGEGLMKLLFLVGYITLISRMKDVKRVFAYHGAEHKVVNAYEFTGELSVETARQYSRIHPRCGTAFIFLAFFIGILVHALLGWPENRLVLAISRLVLIVPVVGISYEVLRLAGRFRESKLLKAIIWPGLLLQRLTTAEPEDEQLEVATAALRAVLEDEGIVEPQPAMATGETATA